MRMGFGSYDESEQERRETTASDEEDVEVDPHGEGHNGESSFELEESTDDMLDQLQEIKEEQAEEDEDAE